MKLSDLENYELVGFPYMDERNIWHSAYALKPIVLKPSKSRELESPQQSPHKQPVDDELREYSDGLKELNLSPPTSVKQPVAKEPKWELEECDLGGIHIEWKNNWPNYSQQPAIKEAVEALMEVIAGNHKYQEVVADASDSLDNAIHKARAALRENDE